MPTLFDVPLRPAEPVNQEIAKALFRAREVVGRIHRPEHIVFWNPAIERGHDTRDPLFAHFSKDVLLVHEPRSILRT